MIFAEVACTKCKRAYPAVGLLYCCPDCAGLFDYSMLWPFNPARMGNTRPGIWRWVNAFGLPDLDPEISLGEGNTPLVWVEAFGRRVGCKCEFLNPTGSFKDRGSATLISALVKRGVVDAVEDSSGNAGASFAAYAARAGIKPRVYVPEAASGPKRRQIEAYGAELVAVPGPRSAAAEAVRLAAQQGAVYASHAYMPFNLPGYASLAVELYAELGEAPGAVLLPAGQGGLLLGVGRGFQAMLAAGTIATMPRLVAVQAAACAPLYSLAVHGRLEAGESPTLAEGVRVHKPVRAQTVVDMVQSSGGYFMAVDERKILSGRDELARRGLYVEPTSALVWRAMETNLADLPDPVIVVLTGSGLKTSVVS